MTRDEFDQLVRRLEEVSRKHPRLYPWRVAALLGLAYGYLGLILIGSLALILGVIAAMIATKSVALLKLVIVVVIAASGLFWAVLRGLWVKMEPPQGQRITRAEAPKLFDMLEELQRALDCQPFHEVLLIPEHNAAVVQIPRLGIFGWHRNYLLLGLPLMQSLGPEEFKAVLAHEFAHSSRGHGRFGNWLYRVRRSWDRIIVQMARQRTGGGAVLWKFLNWFWPLFNAHAFILARANEYEADACSVRLAGAEAAAGALMRLPVDGTLLSEKFWPEIYARAKEEKESSPEVMLDLGRALRSGPDPEAAARSLRTAFLVETNNSDTHPCLRDRLQAIGQLPPKPEGGEWKIAPPPPPAQTAADVLLGSQAETAARKMGEAWAQAVAAHWAERHAEAQKLAGELASLDQPDRTRPPTVEELWTKATKLIDLHDDAAALPVIDQILILDPQHAAAAFVRARHLLEKDDRQGVAWMESALTRNPRLTEAGCNLLYGHYTRTGQRDQLRALEERVDQFRERLAAAQQERNNVTVRDTFLPHGLTPEQVHALATVLQTEPEVGSAAAVRKQVYHFPEDPCFIISLRLNVSWFKPRGSSASQKLVERVVKELQLPGDFLVFVEEDNLKSLGKTIFASPGSVVYQRLA